MFIVCLDLEGVLTPEIWINVAKWTGIKELQITTRDEPNYEILMKKRLQILKDNKITLKGIQKVISSMKLLDGARNFIDWLQSVTQVIILTDSFIQFTASLKKKLGNATILCHHLEVDGNDMISNYILRIENMKKITVKKFKEMNYQVIAVGDSYNDIEMLNEADYGILFRSPENLLKEFPHFKVANKFLELKEIISTYLNK